jgi:tetratricopeptide (TPR) repeat protein
VREHPCIRSREDALPPLPAIDLDHELGAGASGRVWHGALRASHAGLPAGTEVALKRMHRELEVDPLAREAFEREIALGRSLRHPHLVSIVSDGRDELGRWLLMPFVPGKSLRERLRDDGALEESTVRSLGRQLASALAALHERGWRHTDLKPENVRWTPEGRAVLMDLGLARGLADGDRARPGTLAYLSPEQARGGAGEAASDLFALGALLYETATGLHPFAADAEPEAVLEAIGEARLTLPSLHAPRLRPFFDHLCVELCARDPAGRPSARELEQILTEGEAGAWWQARMLQRPRLPHDSIPVRIRPALGFVGRASELERLAAAWSRAREARGAVVWVDGAPGSGKSRLVHELAGRLRAGPEAPALLVARSSEWPEDRPAGALLDLVLRWHALPRDRALSASTVEQLRERMPSADVDVLERALDPARPDPPDALLAHVLVAFFVRAANERPTILFLDDLVWAGMLKLDVVRRLIERLPGTPLLVVLGNRNETPPRERQAFARVEELARTRLAAERIELEPLRSEDVLELVETVFHHGAPRLRIAHVLAERSSGSPALIVEILATAFARGEIGPSPGREPFLELHGVPESLAWPRSLAEALAESFRVLPSTERAWLQRLAVVGGILEPAFLGRAFSSEEPTLRALLARLTRAGWLVPYGKRYRFARPVQRQAVYGMTSTKRRIALHSRAARALAGEEPSPAIAWQRAFHLREAREHAGLLDVLPDLLGTSWSRAHSQRAHTLASWGLEAIDALPPDPDRKRMAVVLLTRAADAADRLGRRAEQRAWLDRLADLGIDPEEDPENAGRVYLLHGRFAASTGDYGLARGLLHNARDFFARAGTRMLESEATRRLAYVQANVGELGQASELADAALALAASEKQRALSETALAVVAVLSDRFEPALAHLDRAIRLLLHIPKADARSASASAYLVRGRTWRILGRPRRALAALARALQLARLSGERRLEIEALARSGQLLLEVDHVREAEERLREAVLAAREIEDRRGEALASLYLGTLLAEADDPEAEHLLERSIRTASEAGLARVASLGLALHARVALAAGDRALAWERLTRALDLLQRFGAELGDRIVIEGTQALLLEGDGRARESRAIARGLARSLAREAGKRQTPIAQQRQRLAGTRLLRAVLSAEGPIYPRSRLRDIPVV